jgi:hypothetical protein
MKFIQSLNSRKLTLTYIGVIASVAVSVWYVNQIQTIEDLYQYISSAEPLPANSLIAIQANFNMTLKEIFGSLMISVAAICGGYMGANAWAKGREQNYIEPEANESEQPIPNESEIED